MRRRIIFSFIILLLVACVVYFGYWYRQPSPNMKSRSARRRVATVTYALSTLKPRQQVIEALGTAMANESVSITSNVSDHVSKIYFHDGQWVQKGQLLVQLDIKQELAQLAQARANLLEAKKQYRRTLALSKRDFLAKSQHDTQVATLKSAQARVQELQAQIQDRTLKAPFAGLLGFRKISLGALVEPGDVITTLDDINHIKADFTLPEKDLNRLKVGQAIAATSVAFAKSLFHGKITTIGSRVDVDTRSLMVRALIDNPKHLLKPGMHLTIRIQGLERQVVLIPESALVPYEDQQYVYVIQSDQTVRRVAVTLGERFGGSVVISEGLKANQKIVVDGGFKLRPGMKVMAMPHKAEATAE